VIFGQSLRDAIHWDRYGEGLMSKITFLVNAQHD